MKLHSHSSEKDRKIQRNIVRLALVLFFVAAISATGGFLRGQQVAITPQSSVATAHQQAQLFFDRDELTCNAAFCRASRDGRNYQIHCPVLGGAGASCSATVIRNGQILETNVPLSALATADARQLILQAIDQSCATGEGDQCRNQCTTTYAVNLGGGEYETRDCYGGPGDRAQPLLQDLAQCMTDQLGPPTAGEATANQFSSEEALKQNICIDQRPVNITDDLEIVVEQGQTDTGEGRLLVPSACQGIVQELSTLKTGAGAQRSATQSDASQCQFKGAVVCYEQPGQAGSGKFTCVQKSGSQRPKADTGPATGGDRCEGKTGLSSFVCGVTGVFDGGFSGKLGFGLGNVIGQGLTRIPSPRDAFNNFRAAFQDRSEPRRQQSAPAPKCILVADKETIRPNESVTLRWRTANARRVDITGIGTGLPSEGQRTVTPNQSMDYVLTAHGADDQKTTCKASVNHEGAAGGPTGENPPRFSCTPPNVETGEQATIKWACTASADRSEGGNLDTAGELSGEIEVSPEHNTQYSVACFDEDDEEIGANTCSINVGEPIYEIMTYPQAAGPGERVRVSWGSLFMDSCRVTGPRGFNYSRTEGVVLTEPFAKGAEASTIEQAVYTMECTSLFGHTIVEDIEVDFLRP